MDYNNIRYTEADNNAWIGRKIKIPFYSVKKKKELEGVIDGLVGESILGKDIDSEVLIEDNDFKTVTGYECFKQSVKNIVEKIPKNTIPEFPNLGSSSSAIVGRNLGALGYPMLKNDFLSLFENEATVEEVKINKITEKDDAIEIDFSFTSVLGNTLDLVYQN